MSYSTPSEKYRKYSALMRENPHNNLYARKLTKYKNMLAKTQKTSQNQKGGTSIIDQIFPNSPSPGSNPEYQYDNVSITNKLNGMIAQSNSNANANSNVNFNSNSKSGNVTTDALVKKINDMVVYAQELGQHGGAKKTTHDAHKKVNRVKGYRKMVGGTINKLLADAHEKLDDHKEIVKNVVTNVGELRKRNTKLERLARAYSQGLNALMNDLQQNRIESSNKATKIKQLENINAGNHLVLDSMVAKNNETRSEITKITHELQIAQQSIATLQQQLQREQSSFEVENKKQNEAIQVLEKEKNELTDIIRARERTIYNLKEQMHVFSTTNAQYQQDNQAQHRKHVANLREKETELKKLQVQLQELQQRLDRATQTNVQNDEQKKSHEAIIHELTTKLNAHTRNIEKRKNAIADLQRIYQNSENELKNISDEFARVRENNNKKIMELESEKHILDDIITRKDQEIVRLTESIKTVETQFESILNEHNLLFLKLQTDAVSKGNQNDDIFGQFDIDKENLQSFGDYPMDIKDDPMNIKDDPMDIKDES